MSLTSNGAAASLAHITGSSLPGCVRSVEIDELGSPNRANRVLGRVRVHNQGFSTHASVARSATIQVAGHCTHHVYLWSWVPQSG